MIRSGAVSIYDAIDRDCWRPVSVSGVRAGWIVLRLALETLSPCRISQISLDMLFTSITFKIENQNSLQDRRRKTVIHPYPYSSLLAELFHGLQAFPGGTPRRTSTEATSSRKKRDDQGFNKKTCLQRIHA